MKADRPAAVTLVACLYLVLGIVTLLGGIWLVLNDHMIWGPITLAAAFVTLLMAAGIFQGWSVMWFIGLLLSTLGIIGGILMIPVPIVNILGIISILVNVLTIIYLLQPHVKDFFLG
jgi:hypothetical protein